MVHENNWSRDVLLNFLDENLYKIEGKLMRYTKKYKFCHNLWQNLSNIRCNSNCSTSCGKFFRMLNLCPKLVRK